MQALWLWRFQEDFGLGRNGYEDILRETEGSEG